MTEPASAPDLLAAGAGTPPQDTPSLMDALRSRGSLPSALLPMLLSGAGSPVSPIAQALSAGVSAYRGAQDPVQQIMAQASRQQAEQTNTMMRVLSEQRSAAYQQQQQEMARKRLSLDERRLAEEMAQRKADSAERQNEHLLTVGMGFLKQEAPELRVYGAATLAEGLKGMGRQVPQNVMDGLAKQRISPEQSTDILKRVGMGYSDEQLTALYPAVSPQALKEYRGMAQDPVTLRALGLPSKDDLLKSQYDLEIKAAQAIESRFPEMKGDPKAVHEMIQQHRTLFGKEYTEGTADTRTRAYEAAKRSIQLDEEKKMRLATDLQTSKLLAGIDARMAAQAAKPESYEKNLKAVQPFQKGRDVVGSIDKIDSMADELDKIGALPKSDNVAAQLAAKAKRATLLKSNPAVFNFQQLWGPISIGQIDRGMFDEKGVRAIQAFSKQLDAVDNMPTKAAIKAYTSTVREQILRKMGADIGQMQLLGASPEAVQAAKEIYAPFAPGSKAVAPQVKKAQFRWNPETNALEPVTP